MIVVCDASPLIFLAKLDRLHLLADLFSKKVHVLQCVVDEVLSDRAGLLEKQRLAMFFEASAEIVTFEEFDFVSDRLSRSDQFSLTYCIRKGADWLVVDERLLRRVANSQKIAVIGCMGLIVQAVRTEIISKEEAKRDIEAAVSQHGMRISVSLYQRILEELR